MMEEDDEFGDLYTDVLTTSFHQTPINHESNSQENQPIDIPKKGNNSNYNNSEPTDSQTQTILTKSPIIDMTNGDAAAAAADDDDGINIDVPEQSEIDIPKNPNLDEQEWDSDESEDDLQIVLNDNDHGPMGDEDDDDEEELVIVADNGQQGIAEEQEERKENGDTSGPLQPKIGYSGHAYHQPFHAHFKYVRPGAQPVPAAAPGMAGQVRPPFPMGISAGRGRGDWRPTGVKGDGLPMQKGYGVPTWGTNTTGRGYGSGLDFTLPSHKTIFEVDIDSFEEKPWKLPGIDVTDFFNFGLNEDSWKDYRKQLEQLRLGTTMQNKIRVYESGRAEQDYDPGLPPELAAAVGNQDIPSECAVKKNIDAGPTDSANVHGRPSPPIGKPIPVDISTGDRLPSIDTRRPRMHDTDVVIEVFCHRSKDDEEMTEQQEADLSDEVDIEGRDEIDGIHNDSEERDNHTSRAYKGRKREPTIKRGHSGYSSLEPPAQQHSDRDASRSAKGKRHVGSPKINAIDEKRERSMDGQDEESSGSGNSKQSPHAIESDGEQTIIPGDDANDKSFDMERAKVDMDDTTKDSLKDKQKLSSQENNNCDDSKVASNLQRRDNVKIPVRDQDSNHREERHEKEEIGRKHLSAKGKEDSHSRESGDPNLSIHRHIKGEGPDENWHRKDDRDGRLNRVEETRKTGRGKVREKEHHQSRNVADKGSWRDFNHDRETGSQQRDRNQSLKILHNKNRREGPHLSREHAAKEDISHSHRETSSRRKRERGDVSDQWKRENLERERDEWHRLKPVPEENISRREREETRSMVRSGRASEDKAWNSHSRRKDEYRGSSKEYQYPSDHLKRRDQFENESYSQLRMGHEDVYARGNLPNRDEKRARHERPGSRNDRAASHAYDASRVNEHKQKESRRTGKDTESLGGSLVPDKRKHDEVAAPTSHTGRPKGKTERGSGGNDRRSPKRQKENALSDEDQPSGSRKGRSKFERWTSNKERDFTTTTSIPSSSLKNKDLDTLPSDEATLAKGLHEDPPRKAEGKPQVLADDNDTGTERNVKAKATEDKQLDTVEKLKKRSERFKLHSVSEKDTTATKKTEIEASPPSVQTEPTLPVSDVKTERPTRKRRWTGN